MEYDKKLFLLDAYALIYRSYYAFIKNPRINSKGMNTSAILGFVNTLEEILKKENPTHIGIAFDPKGPTFRHEVYEQYKAQREKTPEDISQAIPIIKEIIRAYRIPILEVQRYEADDVIGTLATEAGKQNIPTFMLTPDKDYAQLVSENVKMYRPRYNGGYEIMGIEQIKTKYKIQNSSQIIDMLGLMGDTADNIPGCPGIGEKTAQKLIAEFGSIENLLANTDKLKGALKKKVEENKDKINFSKYLATIKTDVPIKLNMYELAKKDPDKETLKYIFTKLEFRTLLDRVLNRENDSEKKKENKSTVKNLFEGDLFAENTETGAEEKKEMNYETAESRHSEYQLIDSKEDRSNLIKLLLTSKIVALDTETTGINAMTAELVGLSFSMAEDQAFYIPIPPQRKEAKKIVEEFKPVYENEKIIKVGQNLKYDLTVLLNYDIEIKGALFDTMVAHYVLQPELRHGMDYLAEIYLHYQTIHIEELIGPKGKNQKNMRDLNPKEVYRYASEDADITLKLKNILEKELKEKDAEKLFYEIEMPLIPVLINMERNGVLIDTGALKQSSTLFTKQMLSLEKEIQQMAGETFNVSSPKQVGEILFDKLKIVEKAKRTKGGQYVTSEEALMEVRHKHVIVEKILEYRGLKKLLG
ncbi:MAG: DNA polymerase, partial [Bacteroidaceae bacterium]|nr:DNA polymerase [Bacteroidaceae bacterium]